MKSIKELPGLIFGIIILIVLSPIIIGGFILLGLMYIIELLSNDKSEIPAIDRLTDKADSPEIIANIYVDKIKSLFPEINIIKKQDQKSKIKLNYYEMRSTKGNASIYWNDSFVGLEVPGADTGYWNTAEEETIDVLFWFVVGALRNGVKYRRPIIGFKQAWIYSDEYKIWAVVPKNNHGYGYTKTRKVFPGSNR